MFVFKSTEDFHLDVRLYSLDSLQAKEIELSVSRVLFYCAMDTVLNIKMARLED